jgi:diguanylate cyclase (GGDEF)-like protein
MRGFSDVLSSRFDLTELGRGALDALLAFTGADAGAILVVREDTLEPLASHALRTADGLAENDHVRRAMRLDEIARVTVAGSAIVVDSILIGQPAQEILVAPVSFKNVPLGVIILATSSAFDPDAAKLLEQFRGDLGLAINNALAHDRLERLAAVDPLTDAYNRRFGLARLGEEYSRAIRAENPLGVLMFDLDHFKTINDTYGHLVGDRVLRAVARVFRRVLREGDVLIRYGGEEFLVLLPGAGPDDIREIGERIRRAVGETTVPEGDQRIAVTVSAGGASYRDSIDSPDALIAAADAALYEAKDTGRNRIVMA